MNANTLLNIDNFIDKDTCQYYIDFIDSNIDEFRLSDGSQEYPEQRYTLRFGYDEHRPDLIEKDYSKISSIMGNLDDLFEKVIIAVKEYYEEKEDLYVTSFFISKHLPGKAIKVHHDATPINNSQLDYTVLLYLNDLNNNGALKFPGLGVEVIPSAGKLVAFESWSPVSHHGINEVTEDRYSIPIWLTKDKNFIFHK